MMKTRNSIKAVLFALAWFWMSSLSALVNAPKVETDVSMEVLWEAYHDDRYPDAICNITAMIFTPDGNLFAARDVRQIPERIGKCTLWNATSRKIIYDNFNGNGGWYVPSLTLGLSDEILVAGLQYGIFHHFRSTMVRLLDLSSDWIDKWFVDDSLCARKLAIGPDKNTLAIYYATFNSIYVIRNFFGKQDYFHIRIYKDRLPSLAFNRTGNLLAIGEGDGNVTIWDIETQTCVHNFRCESAVRALAFSSNGKFLAYADSNNKIKLRSLEKKLCIHEIKLGEGVVASLAFSLDGTKIAVGFYRSGKILVWNIAPWKNDFC